MKKVKDSAASPEMQFTHKYGFSSQFSSTTKFCEDNTLLLRNLASAGGVELHRMDREFAESNHNNNFETDSFLSNSSQGGAPYKPSNSAAKPSTGKSVLQPLEAIESDKEGEGEQ